MYRTNSYNEEFSREIRNPVFAQAYFSELLNNEDAAMSVEQALRFVIRRMGTTDFANLVGESKQTIDKFLKGERKPKLETLNKLLRPFNLETKLIVGPINNASIS